MPSARRVNQDADLSPQRQSRREEERNWLGKETGDGFAVRHRLRRQKRPTFCAVPNAAVYPQIPPTRQILRRCFPAVEADL